MALSVHFKSKLVSVLAKADVLTMLVDNDWFLSINFTQDICILADGFSSFVKSSFVRAVSGFSVEKFAPPVKPRASPDEGSVSPAIFFPPLLSEPFISSFALPDGPLGLFAPV